VITEYELVVLGGECAWLIPYDEHFPTLAHVQQMSAFIRIVSYANLKLYTFIKQHCEIYSFGFFSTG